MIEKKIKKLRTEYQELINLKTDVENSLNILDNDIKEKEQEILININDRFKELLKKYYYTADNLEVYGLTNPKGLCVEFKMDNFSFKYYDNEIKIDFESQVTSNINLTDTLISKLKAIIEEVINKY